MDQSQHPGEGGGGGGGWHSGVSVEVTLGSQADLFSFLFRCMSHGQPILHFR